MKKRILCISSILIILVAIAFLVAPTLKAIIKEKTL